MEVMNNDRISVTTHFVNCTFLRFVNCEIFTFLFSFTYSMCDNILVLHIQHCHSDEMDPTSYIRLKYVLNSWTRNKVYMHVDIAKDMSLDKGGG
jgi:hypothetical protein